MAVGYLSVVETTVDMTVSRNERVVVALWGGSRGRVEGVVWEREAGERLGLRRMVGMVLAVMERGSTGRIWSPGNKCIACRRHGRTRGWEMSTDCVT